MRRSAFISAFVVQAGNFPVAAPGSRGRIPGLLGPTGAVPGGIGLRGRRDRAPSLATTRYSLGAAFGDEDLQSLAHAPRILLCPASAHGTRAALRGKTGF